MRRLALVSTGHKGLSVLSGFRYTASWTKQGSICAKDNRRRSRRGMLTASERSQTRSPWRHNRKRSRSKVPDRAIVDLRERLGRTRFPDQAPGEPWAYGTDLSYLQHFVEYWPPSTFVQHSL